MALHVVTGSDESARRCLRVLASFNVRDTPPYNFLQPKDKERGRTRKLASYGSSVQVAPSSFCDFGRVCALRSIVLSNEWDTPVAHFFSIGRARAHKKCPMAQEVSPGLPPEITTHKKRKHAADPSSTQI